MYQNSDDMVWATQNIYTSPISSVDNAYSMTSSSQDSFSSNISEKVPSPDSTNTPGKPYLKIMEEPANQFRFRYKSEMQGTHGAILGARATKNEKTYPTVKLFNYDGDAVIRCTLYTAENKRRRPHVHRLVGKMSGRTEKDDPHDMRISQTDNHTACFQNLVIIHTAKKVLVDELLGKKKRIAEARFTQKLNIEEKLLGKMRIEAEQDAKGMNMNSVSLKFEAFSLVNQQYIQICEPVYSQPINNMKSHVTGQLRICRLSKFYSSCEGGEEILLFVEKVGKNNIKVLFTERDDYGNEVWRDYATHVEVHHQFGISCRCPKYKSQDISREVLVQMQLERPSDGATSETRDFVYKPADYSNTSTKRRRLDSVVFTNQTPDSTCNPQMDRFGDDWSTVLPTGAASSVVLQSSNTDPLLRFIEPHRDVDDFVMIKDALFSSQVPIEVMAENTSEENASSSISFSAEMRNYPTPPETMIPDVYSSEELQKAIQEDAIAPEYGELVPDRVYTRNLKPKKIATGIQFQMADPDELVTRSQAYFPDESLIQPEAGPPEDYVEINNQIQFQGPLVSFPREKKTKDGITIAYPEGHLTHPSNQSPPGMEFFSGVSSTRAQRKISKPDELVTRVQAGFPDPDELVTRSQAYIPDKSLIRPQADFTGYFSREEKTEDGYIIAYPESHYMQHPNQRPPVPVLRPYVWTGFHLSDPSNPILRDRRNRPIARHEGGSQNEFKEENLKQSSKLSAVDFVEHTWRRLNQIIDTAVFPHVTKADIENKLLMELETRTARGDSVLHTAVRLHQFVLKRRILECIKAHIDDISPIVNCPNTHNRQTPLHLLVQMNDVADRLHIRIIEYMLQVGADPNKTDKFELNALHLAVKENNVNAVKCLLEFPGININQVSANMGTALHIAAEENRVEVARLLLKHGADVNSIDLQKGQTPLHVAVKKSNLQIVELLLKQADIDINKEDYRCQTPLKFAILRADTRLLKIVNKLINRGATFESTDVEEETDDSLESVEENATKTTAKNRKMQTLAFLFSQISVNENLPSEIPFIDTSNIEYHIIE